MECQFHNMHEGKIQEDNSTRARGRNEVMLYGEVPQQDV